MYIYLPFKLYCRGSFPHIVFKQNSRHMQPRAQNVEKLKPNIHIFCARVYKCASFMHRHKTFW